jgi:glycine C-acetyltransferase
VAATLAALQMLQASTELRDQLEHNTRYFRDAVSRLGLTIAPGEHPIVPIMLGDARVASQMADNLLDKGIYVIGFSFPVVPQGKARIRTQISAAHSQDDLAFAVEQFGRAKAEVLG